jgi:protein-tyrosine phosphatase
MRDYLLSNAYLLPAFAETFDAFRAAGGDPALLHPVVGVDEAYLTAALDEMHARFGTVEDYFADGLGLLTTEQATLRAAYLV